MNQNRNNDEDGTAPPVAAGTAPPVAAVTTACRIMAHEHNDPLKNAYASHEQTRKLLASWNAERKVAIEVCDKLNESKDMITMLEGKINESAEEIIELKKKNEKLKQGIKRKLAEMKEQIEKVQSELIEQIEKDVEEETDAGIV